MKDDLYTKLSGQLDRSTHALKHPTLADLCAQHKAAHPVLSDREVRLAVIRTDEGRAAYGRESVRPSAVASVEHVNPFLGQPRAELQAELDKLAKESGGYAAAVRSQQGRDLYNALAAAR